MGAPRLKQAGWTRAVRIVLAGLILSPAALVAEVKKPAGSDPQSIVVVPPALREIAVKAEYFLDLCNAMKLEWPKNRAITIVCHGHSVPAGYFKTPAVRIFDAYPMLLHKTLCDRFPTAVINVTVTAIGGENSVKGAERFERDVLSLRPDVVTIDYGLNDRPIGLQAARQAWASMIEKAKAANIKVILLTPTPDMAAKLDDVADPLNRHANLIRELAAEYQVGLVDSLATFKKYLHDGGKLEEVMSQGNHPNRKGHELVAAELAEWFGGR